MDLPDGESVLACVCVCFSLRENVSKRFCFEKTMDSLSNGRVLGNDTLGRIRESNLLHIDVM